MHVFGQAQQYRDGAQGFGHATDAGRFLADQAVTQAEIFVRHASRHMTDTKLGDHIAGPFHSGTLVGGQYHLERAAFGDHHTLGETADDPQPFQVDIHQPKFGHR